MPVSVDKLVDIINNKIVAGGQDVIDLARLYGSTQALSGSYSVANTASLPAASDNTGRFIYVEDIGAYRYSDGTQWTNDYDTTLTATSGQLWAWGCNLNGRLGDGTTTDRCSPVREFCSATDWCQVSAGDVITTAVKTSGELWTVGFNFCGLLGDGTTTNSCTPVREICSATNWCQVSASLEHLAAIKTSGELWVWGNGRCGDLGDGTTTAKCSPVREFCSATDWCQVSVGDRNTAGIKTSGELWAWGASFFGELGDGTTTPKCSPVREFCSATDWCGVSASRQQTMAIKTSGEIWGWGCNSTGRLGDGTTTDKCSPVQEFCSATNWTQVSAGRFNSGAIKTDGSIWNWGSGSNGQLGDGTTTGTCSPIREICSATDWCYVSLGETHTAAVKTSGEIWSWGSGSRGRLGDGTALSRCSPVREFCSATDWCQVSTFNHTAALKITKGFNEP